MDHCFFGTAFFCNGEKSICYMAIISSSCTIAVIKLHASLLPATLFYSEAMFQRALFVGDSSRGGGSSMACLGVIDHIVGFILSAVLLSA